MSQARGEIIDMLKNTFSLHIIFAQISLTLDGDEYGIALRHWKWRLSQTVVSKTYITIVTPVSKVALGCSSLKEA